MTAAMNLTPADPKRPPRPSDYPCPAGQGGHYMLTEKRAGVLIPSCELDGGPIIWVCIHCGLRFQTGVGLVP